ncbi:G-protein coupled receptor 1-like [Megalops cyprinoides]|uniref:G-protein coupled receptor 1-like n=1 Tax=Megalops cyprinoides TaxID=118141 RepID=UPI0018640ED3|nr:G-protein coupled receptor 1-like [Megalops cyprinoides]XP_036401752.1 G-protein coupled receptor 1-like [Megalops cyprinoides]
MEEFENYSYEYLEYGDFEEVEQGYVQREALHIISVVIYSISFVLGLIGNGIVIWVMAFKSKRTVNSVWLQNLAMADFLFVLFLPFSIDYVLRDFHWKFGLAMCKLNSFVSMVNMYASVFFLTVLSLDRYFSLVHISRAQRLRTVQRAWGVCGGVWGLAAAISFPALILRDTIQLHNRVVCFNNFYAEDRHTAALRHIAMVTVRALVGFLLPFCAISVSSILLAVQVHRSDSARLSSFSRTISALILAFFLCWAPFHIFSLMELSMHSTLYLHVVLQTGFPLATSLAFFNSCINPLLYVLLGKKVRRMLKRSCLDITKSSLQEISQSISATESVSAPVSCTAEEPTALSAV